MHKAIFKGTIILISFAVIVSLIFAPLTAVVAIAQNPLGFAFNVFTSVFGFDLDESLLDGFDTTTGGQIVSILFSNRPDIKSDIQIYTDNHVITNKVALIIVFYSLDNYTLEDLQSLVTIFENHSSDPDNKAALEEIKDLYFIKNKAEDVPDETVLQALKTAALSYSGGGASNIPGLTVRTSSPAYEPSNPFFFTNTNIYVPRFIGQCTWYSFGRILEMANEIGYDLDMAAMRALHSNGGDWFECAMNEQSTFELCTDVTKPRAGAVISWGGSLYNGVECGHVAVIERVNEDGTIATSEAWFNGSEIIFTYKDSVTLDYVANKPSGYPGHPFYFNGYIYCIDVPEDNIESDKNQERSDGNAFENIYLSDFS